jgi:hypothetical protein
VVPCIVKFTFDLPSQGHGDPIWIELMPPRFMVPTTYWPTTIDHVRCWSSENWLARLSVAWSLAAFPLIIRVGPFRSPSKGRGTERS